MVNGEMSDGWEWTTVGECSTVVTGGTPSKKDISNYGNFMPFVKPPELLNGAIFTAEDNISEKGTKEARVLPVNSVLVSCIGNLGKTGINRVPVAFNQQINAVIFPENIIPEFGLYYFQSPKFKRQLEDISSATTVAIVNKSKFASLSFPIAPLPEQERIVAKIEELFTQLEAATSALERVQAGLRRYKASVLKTAVEGKLGTQKDEFRFGEGELPEGWRWVTVGEVAEHRLGKMLDKEKNKGKLHPYLRNINVRWFEFDFSDIQEMRVLDVELHNISIQKGDLIICEGGEPGRAAVWNKDETMVIQKALHRVRTNENVLPTYLMYCLAADANNGKLEKYFTGSTIKHFTGQSLENYEFPLPPLEEQRRIVAEVERRLSVAREVETVVEKALARSSRLRQAVLKSAFEGRLV